MISTYSIKSKVIAQYYDMLTDINRNMFYQGALRQVAKDKVVVDIGSGTGILSHYALSAGAKFVYAIERRADVADITSRILGKSFDQSRFKVIYGDWWSKSIRDSIDMPVDIIVSETVGPGLFDQGMIKSWMVARELGNDDLVSIPERLAVDAWIFDRPHDISLADFTSTRTSLTNHHVLDDAFLDAMRQVDTEVYKGNKSTESLSSRWMLTNKEIPSRIMPSIFDFSYRDMPDTDPNNGQPVIATDIKLDRCCALAVINRITYDDKAVYLHDSPSQPWRYSPAFIINEPGTYRLSWNNHSHDFFGSDEWTLRLID